MNEGTAISYDHAVRSLEGLGWLHEEVSQFLQHSGSQPILGSIAAMEAQEPKLGRRAVDAHQQGTVLIEVGADHIQALLKTLTNPVQTVAPFALVRSLLECFALASWLLDPEIDVRCRAGRRYAVRYEGLRQQRSYSGSSNRTEEQEKIDKKIVEVESEAIAAGFANVTNKDGKRCGIGQQFPMVTCLVKDTLHEEPAYRLLSAFIHAHFWAIEQLSYHREGSGDSARKTADPIGREVVYLKKEIAGEAVLWLALKSVTSFARPLLYRCKLFGHDCNRLTSILESACNRCGFGAEARFWRQDNTQ